MKKSWRVLFFVLLALLGATGFQLFYAASTIKVIALAVVGASLCFFAPFQREEHQKRDRVIALLIALFWTASTYQEGLHESLLNSLFGGLLTFIFYTVVFFLLIQFLGALDNDNSLKHRLQKRKVHLFLMYFLPLFLVWGGLLVIVHPGIMTNDSYNQWAQVMGLTPLSAWHPLIHTFSIKLVSFASQTPFLYLLCQVVFGASLVAGVMVFLDRKGLAFIWRFMIVAFYAIFPVNAIFMATLWKDIPYSLFLLWFVYLVYRGTVNKEEGMRFLRQYQPLLIFVGFMTMEFRKNGLIVVILTVLLAALLNKSKRWWVTFVLLLICHFGFSTVTENVMGAVPSPKYEALSVPLQQVAAAFKEDGDFKASDRAYFESILPAEKWKENYDATTVDPLKFDGSFKGQVIEEDFGGFLKHWASLLKSNFGTFVKAYLDHSASLWRYARPEGYEIYIGIDQPTQEQRLRKYINANSSDDSSLEKLLDESYKRRIRANGEYISKSDYDKKAKQIIESFQTPILFPNLSDKIWTFIKFNNGTLQKYLYRGALGILILLLLLAVCVRRRINLLFMVPVVINVLTLFISIPATHYRYIYSLIFSLPILLGLIMLPKIKSPDVKEMKELPSQR